MNHKVESRQTTGRVKSHVAIVNNRAGQICEKKQKLALGLWGIIIVIFGVFAIFLSGLYLCSVLIAKTLFWAIFICICCAMRYLHKVDRKWIIICVLVTIVLWNILPLGKVYLYGVWQGIRKDGYIDGLVKCYSAEKEKQAIDKPTTLSAESSQVGLLEIPKYSHFYYDGIFMTVSEYSDAIYYAFHYGRLPGSTVLVYNKTGYRDISGKHACVLEIDKKEYYLSCSWSSPMPE